MSDPGHPIPRLFRLEQSFGRHIVSKRLDAATEQLPPIPLYRCLRKPSRLESRPPDAAAWAATEWSDPFPEICDGETTVETRIAILWDDDNLYVAFRVAGPHRSALMHEPRDHVYVADDSVELFVEGDGHYWEIGRNSVNNGYEVRWVWLEQLVDRRDFDALESWVTTDDFIYYRSREGEPIGRIGDLNYQLPGLTTDVGDVETASDGMIESWTAHMMLPFDGLRQAVGGVWPPPPDQRRRIAGYRIHHGVGAYDPELRPQQQTWSVMGNRDIHNPERWTDVVFVDVPVDEGTAPTP